MTSPGPLKRLPAKQTSSTMQLGNPICTRSMQPPGYLIDSFNAALDVTSKASASALLRSEILRPPAADAAVDTLMTLAPPTTRTGIPVAVLGAGDYVRTETIPALRSRRFSLYCLADREPHIAAAVGRSRKFRFATTEAERAISELPPHGLVIVATAHDSHASLACLAAEAGHRVFLEKPPTVTAADVLHLREVMASHPGMIEIGYNRRYHPLVRRARERIQSERGPISITCTVKELPFQPDHWYFWANQGTRFTGNLCHWIDLAIFFLDDGILPVSLTLSPRVISSHIDDEERVLTVTFSDGSLLSIFGTSRGDDSRGVQEQIDIRRGGTTISIDDLWKMRVRSGGIERYYRTIFRDKAHSRMYREALGRVANGEAATYGLRDMIVVSAIQITASDLVRAGGTVGQIPSWLEDALQDKVNWNSSAPPKVHAL